MNKFILSILLSTAIVHFNLALSAEQTTSRKELSFLGSSSVEKLIEGINKKYQKHDNAYKSTHHSNTTIEIIKSDIEIPAFIGIPDGEELVLTVQVEKYLLGELFAYKSKGGAKISLLSFFEIIEFPINIDFDKKIATGWFIKEGYGFDLNYSKSGSVAIIKGKSFPINPEHILIEEDDIYVESQILSQWFDLGVEFNFSTLFMLINPTEPIPIQQRLARENKKNMVRGNKASIAPWKESSYEMLSSPLFDVQLTHSNNNRGGNFSTYSILGGHDFAYLNSEYYVAGNSNNSFDSARITFSKESGKNNLLGPLKVNRYAFGDVIPISSSINYNSNLSRGFVISQGLSDTHLNNRTNINGNILPGWDIELYHNGIFIEKQLSLQSGRYEFNDLELLYGNNIFEIISYGPQGQVETSTKEFYIDGNNLAANSSSYGFSVTQVGESVLGVDPDISNSHGWLFAGAYNYGFTDWISMNLGYSSFFTDEIFDTNGEVAKDIKAYTLGSSVNVFERMLLNFQGDFSDDDTHSILFSAKTAIAEQAISYSYNEDKYGSITQGDSLDAVSGSHRTHNITMSGPLKKSGTLKINYQNIYSHNTAITGVKSQNFTNSLGFQTNGLSIQNRIDWRKIELSLDKNTPLNDFNVEEYLNGGTSLQRMFGTVFARFSVDYNIKPTPEIDKVSSELSTSLFDNTQSNIKLNYYTSSERYQAEIGMNFQQESYNINSTVTFDNQDNWRFGINFRFSFGYQLDQKESMFSAVPITSKGSLMVRVFEDDNLNGTYDEGEVLVEGAKVKALQSYNQGISNDNGIALIKGMKNNQITDIELDKDSLGDGFLLPSKGPVAITPRKGYLGHLDFPVVTSSEVEGNIYLTDDEGVFKPLGYVTIHLIDIEGNIVKTTQSEYDGYYLFVELLPGQYFVAIDEAYLAKRKLRNINNIPISLTAQGDVINGSDFNLEELEFSEGFVVKAGEFSSLKMLQAYWYIIKKQYRSHLNQKVFYIENKNTEKYQLNLGFYETEMESVTACDKISTMKINCTVEPYKFGF